MVQELFSYAKQCYVRAVESQKRTRINLKGLVYIFIGLFAFAIAVTAYLGLTFTPIESVLLGLIGLGFALLYLQRTLFQREIERLERSIQDLSRLLSTDARAGQNLSQRLNELTDIEPAQRLETLEGDVSVLGTVVRQLAESLAEMERNQYSANSEAPPDQTASTDDRMHAAPQSPPEPVIPLEMLRQALGEDRIIHHIEPIITLPQRRIHGYDLVPRLMLEDGELAEAEDFMPLRGGEDVIAEIEALALVDAITFARKNMTTGNSIMVYSPLSATSLKNTRQRERVISLLDANKAISAYIGFVISEQQWADLGGVEQAAIETIVKKGASFSLSSVRSLRLNYATISALGVRSVRADTKRFIDQPASYTDFHTADIAAYVNRFEVDLLMINVQTEQDVLTLLDDGIGLAQGPHLALPGPIREDFMNPAKRNTKPKLA